MWPSSVDASNAATEAPGLGGGAQGAAAGVAQADHQDVAVIGLACLGRIFGSHVPVGNGLGLCAPPRERRQPPRREPPPPGQIQRLRRSWPRSPHRRQPESPRRSTSVPCMSTHFPSISHSVSAAPPKRRRANPSANISERKTRMHHLHRCGRARSRLSFTFGMVFKGRPACAALSITGVCRGITALK